MKRCLATGLAFALAAGCYAARADDQVEEDPAARARTRASERDLKPFHTLRSQHFVAVGNASDAYLRIALLDCEAVARDFVEHFKAKGFPVALPERRMTIVVLEGDLEFKRFIGVPPSRARVGRGFVAGLFQRKENWLVLQDFRNFPDAGAGTYARGLNLETLAHEATHQLGFNTGLLQRLGDVPLSLLEGLAAYGEVRREGVPSPPGKLNRRRLDDLAHAQRGAGWIPVPRLLTDDSWQAEQDHPRFKLAYAEGWLLVHYLMAEPEHTAHFRDYLAAIRDRRDPAQRTDDARRHLGDLDALDRVLKRYSVTLLGQM